MKKRQNSHVLFLMTIGIILMLTSASIVTLPVQATCNNDNVAKSIIGSTYRYTISDPNGIDSIKLFKINNAGQLIQENTWSPGGVTSYTINIDAWHISDHFHLLQIKDRQSNPALTKWKIDKGTGNPSRLSCQQKTKGEVFWSFYAPLNLSQLEVPSTISFMFYRENVSAHELEWYIPPQVDAVLSGWRNLEFLYGHWEISLNWSEEDPDIVVFKILNLTMTYSETTIESKSTGLNTAIADSTSYGTLNITSGTTTVYETGIYINNIYTRNNPIKYWIIYTGFVNFTSNEVNLEGEGCVEFPIQVGGISIFTNLFDLLAPYIGFVSTTVIALTAATIYIKHFKHKKQKQ